MFSVDKKWKTAFYRFLDSGDVPSHDFEKALAIEKDLFLNIKPQVEKELGTEWDGQSEANRLADFKVAQSVKKSFFNYEKNRASGDPKFFTF